MTPDPFYQLQIIIASLACGATALLGFLFYNLSLTTAGAFTRTFLRLLSLSATLKVLAIFGAVYRNVRVESSNVPFDAVMMSLAGRGIELFSYAILIWFLLRPETKKALNGAVPLTSTKEKPG